MRELTFVGFLSRYVRNLSTSGTNSISKLSHEAASDNYRLREPLFLYALFSGKEDLLLRNIENSKLKEKYINIYNQYSKELLLNALMNNDSEVPAEYRKIWRSYQAQKNRKETDANTKERIRLCILSMQKDKGVSNYRIYKELGLNPGNINDWLKNGTGEKVSLVTARRTFEFLNSYRTG